jgi:putative restriction endonuclease
MARGRLWTREELILALSVYNQIPFGRMNDTTPEVIELANLIHRSPNTVAIRLGNFAACDPYILNSGRKGMPGGTKTCKPIWDEFYGKREALFLTAQQIKANLLQISIEKTLNINVKDYTGKERQAMVKQRINQNCFRAMILNNYEKRCAVTGINIPDLLVASHIIPWAEKTETRLDPENGLCLSSLYDKAFDKGYITVNPDDYTLILSSALLEYQFEAYFENHFSSINHRKIVLPLEHAPNKDYLDYHKSMIFKGI